MGISNVRIADGVRAKEKTSVVLIGDFIYQRGRGEVVNEGIKLRRKRFKDFKKCPTCEFSTRQFYYLPREVGLRCADCMCKFLSDKNEYVVKTLLG